MYVNASGSKWWHNVFMRSNAGYPISSWIHSSIYEFFFFDYGVYLVSTSIGSEGTMASISTFLCGALE